MLVTSCAIAAAATWTVALQAPSSGQRRSRAPPSAPTAPTGVCVAGTSPTVQVGWTGVAHAASYAVSSSPSGSSGTYALLASGVTTNPYTTTSLAQGTYRFEVTVLVGSNWTSAKSVATPTPRTIRNSGTRCA